MAPSIPQEAVELWFFVTLKSLSSVFGSEEDLVEGWSTGTSDSTDLEDHACFSSAKPRL